MTGDGASSGISPGNLADEIVQNTKLHLNLGQDAIVITEDKVRLCLMEHLKRMEARRTWIAPVSVLVTIIAVFVTTEFKDDFVFKAATWEAIFFLLGVMNFGWLVVAVWRAWKAPNVEDIVKMMKKAGA